MKLPYQIEEEEMRLLKEGAQTPIEVAHVKEGQLNKELSQNLLLYTGGKPMSEYLTMDQLEEMRVVSSQSPSPHGFIYS